MKFFESDQTTRFACEAPGGVFSPGALGELARAAQQFGSETIRVALDQGLALDLPDARSAKAFRGSAAARSFAGSTDRLSISSSIAAVDTDANAATPWLTESVYLDLIALCGSQTISPENALAPRRVHIGDPRLSLSPRYPADWNFLAADIRHHWHAGVYDRHGLLRTVPYLLPSYLLGQVLEAAAEFAASQGNADEPGEDILEWMSRRFADSVLAISTTRGSTPAIPAPEKSSAPYEGLNEARDGSSLWLGVCRSAAGFSPLFLDELAYLCRKYEVGRIYSTHWHSLIIKNIPPASRADWLALIARHGLNLRHDSAALYWQVADGYETIRERIVQALRAADAGTAGLSFAVGPKALRSGALIALVPEGRQLFGEFFALYHRQDFDRSREHWQKFAGGLGIRELIRAVCELRAQFLAGFQLKLKGPDAAASIDTTVAADENAPAATEDADPGLWSCPDCRTLYDPRYGDIRSGAPANTSFEELPAEFRCPVCEAPREAFVRGPGEYSEYSESISAKSSTRFPISELNERIQK